MQEDDRLLKEALQDLAPTAGESGVYDPLKIQAQVRRRKRRRRLTIAGAAVVVAAALGLGAYGITQWWPQQDDILVIDDDSMGVAGHGSQASNGTWREISLPQSGSIAPSSLVMDPSNPATLYAGTDDGLYISRDGAATWTQMWAGTYINSITVDPGNPSAVYVVAPDKNGHMSLQRSTDAGATWTQMTGAAQEVQGQLWIDSSVSPSILYMSGMSQAYGLLKSTDDGATWEGLTAEQGSQLLVCQGSVLYAQTQYQLGPSLAKSSDGGSTWEDVDAPIPTADESGNYSGSFSLRSDPADPSRLYLYVYESDSVSPNEYLPPTLTVYVSDDGTSSWSQLDGNDLERARAVEGAAPGTPAAAIDAAAEFLVSFQESRYSMSDPTDGVPFRASEAGPSVVIDPTDPSILYVAAFGTHSGVYKSTDQGVTWSDTTTGIATAASVGGITIDPQAPTTLYATTMNSVLRSTDGGNSWETVFEEAGYASLALAPSSPSTLYLVNQDGLSRSDDGGSTWTTPACTGLPATGSDSQFTGMLPLSSLLVSHESPNILLAETTDGVYRSADGGNSWTKPVGLPATPSGFNMFSQLPNGSSLFTTPNAPSTFYAVLPDTSDGYSLRLFTSTDGGLTWIALANLSIDEATSYLPVVIDPGDPMTIYADRVTYQLDDDGLPTGGYGGSGSTWRSTDGAKTWSRAKSKGVDYIDSYSTRVDPWAAGTLYTVSQSGMRGNGQAIYRSTDRAESWEKLCDGPEEDDDFYMQSVVPSPDGSLYVTTGRGIYKWTP